MSATGGASATTIRTSYGRCRSSSSVCAWPGTGDTDEIPAVKAARGGHHGARSSGSTRAVEDRHRRRGGGNGGRARLARAGPGGEVVVGDGGAEAEGARQRHRLPPPHLRRQVPGR